MVLILVSFALFEICSLYNCHAASTKLKAFNPYIPWSSLRGSNGYFMLVVSASSVQISIASMQQWTKNTLHKFTTKKKHSVAPKLFCQNSKKFKKLAALHKSICSVICIVCRCHAKSTFYIWPIAQMSNLGMTNEHFSKSKRLNQQTFPQHATIYL